MCKYKTYKTASWHSSQYQANLCCQNDTKNIKTRLLFYNSKAQVCWRASTKPASTHHLSSQLAIFCPHFSPSLPWWLEVKTSRQVARERLWHIFVFFQEVSSQLISTTSVLSVLVGGIYNGKWLPVRTILWNHLHHFQKSTAPLSGLREPISCCSFTPWQVKNACK